jgi:hypothetical protein
MLEIVSGNESVESVLREVKITEMLLWINSLLKFVLLIY